MTLKSKIMSLISFSYIYAFPAAGATGHVTSTSKEGTIRVIVEGVADSEGSIRLSLDRDESSFEGITHEDFRVGSVAASAGKTMYEFRNIPFGKYAIKLFHDANNNDKLDLNLLGIPAEAYGISNDARGMFGLPGFAEAAFGHDHTESVLTIHVRPHLSH